MGWVLPPCECDRDNDHRDAWCGDDAESDDVLPRCEAYGNGRGEHQPGKGLDEDEQTVEPEALMAREPASGEVGAGIGDRRPDENPVVDLVTSEDIVGDRSLERNRNGEEDSGEAGLKEHRDPQRVAFDPPRPAVGEGARQELLDRPVDDRDDHEEDAPEERYAVVAGVSVERVAGDGEVGECDEAGGSDPDRKDPRPGPE